MAAVPKIKFRVVISVRNIAEGGFFQPRKMKVDATNHIEAIHLAKLAARREGLEVGITLDWNSCTWWFNAMVRRDGEAEFYELERRRRVVSEADVNVEAEARKLLQSEGYEVGDVYNIIDSYTPPSRF